MNKIWSAHGAICRREGRRHAKSLCILKVRRVTAEAAIWPAEDCQSDMLTQKQTIGFRKKLTYAIGCSKQRQQKRSFFWIR